MIPIALEVISVLTTVAPAIQAWIANPDERTLETVIEDAMLAAFPNPLASDTIGALFALVDVASSLGVIGAAPYEVGPGTDRGR